MTTSHISAILTGESMMGKYTFTIAPPSHDAIARLAYQYYEMRGRRHGKDVDDWLAAEEVLTIHYR